MRKILTFLASDGSFLFATNNCRIVDSKYVDAFGGTGSCTLRDNVMEIKLWLDRDQLHVEFRATASQSSDAWISMDIIRQLLDGEPSDHSILDDENVEFLQENFSRIQERFIASNLSDTVSVCKKLKKHRAKRLFG